MFTVKTPASPRTSKVTIVVNDSPVTIIVDNGARVNILCGHAYDGLQHRPTIHGTATLIFVYRSKQVIPVRGFITTNIKFKKKRWRANISIVDDKDPFVRHKLQNLLSVHSVGALGIITFNFGFHVTVPILDEFPSLFDRKIAKISGSTINLHIDPSDPLVTQCQPRPHRCRKAIFADCWQWYMLLNTFISIYMGRGSSSPLTIDHFLGL